MKCTNEICSKEAIIFELPSKFESSAFDRACHCFTHYEMNQTSWDWEVQEGLSTWSEEVYLLDALKNEL